MTESPEPRPFASLQRCAGAGSIAGVRARSRPESAGQADEEGSDFAQLVAGPDSFFTDNGLYQKSDMDVVTAETIKEEDLAWCVMSIFDRLILPIWGA